MHFAFPPGKSSTHPLPFRRPVRSNYQRRRQLQLGAILLFALLITLYFGRRLLAPQTASSRAQHIPAGTPEIVIVTVLDKEYMSERYRDRVVENRNYYAKKHGKW